MAFPPLFREPPPELPSIRTPGVNHFRSRHHDAPFGGRSLAVEIPGIQTQDYVPPPLPPPPMPFGMQPGQTYDPREKRDVETGFRSSLGGYGSIDSSYNDERPNFTRRDTSSTNGDEGYASYSTDSRSRDSFPTEFGLFHNKLQLQSPADMHTDSMKKKLDSILSTDRSPPASLSSSLSDLFPRRNPAYPPLQLPMHIRGPLDSPNRRIDSTLFAAVSPRSAPFAYSPGEQRSPRELADLTRSSPGRSTRHNSDDATSIQTGPEYHGAEDMEIDESSSLKRLHIEDDQGSVRQKRRAATPQLSEDYAMHGASSQSDAVRRREIGSRGSPAPRLYTLTQSVSMPTAPGSNSYMSPSSLPPSATSNVTSVDCRSPSRYSPGGTSPTVSTSPGTMSVSLNPSPRGSISDRPPAHARTMSSNGSKKLDGMSKSVGSKLQDFFMCECCPKKPKKFETAEELRAHTAEKQYGCNYCPNRFKNKNEAERHQNSLHVRRHSWSCSVLSGYDRAFHESPNSPGEADICGYCGDEFVRSGQAPGGGALSGGIAPMIITEQDWEDRIEHLQAVHKFRECNSSKKFFRADHFRQHLKHSHAGFSGKWTNMLENACMIEEEPPMPR